MSEEQRRAIEEAGGEVVEIEVSLWHAPYWEVSSADYERQEAELYHWPDPETGRSRIRFSVEFDLPASAAALQAVSQIVLHSRATKQPILALDARVSIDGESGRLRITPPEIYTPSEVLRA